MALPVTMQFGLVLIYAVKFSKTLVEKIMIDHEIAKPDVIEQGREQKAKNQAIFRGYLQEKTFCKGTYFGKGTDDAHQFFKIRKGEESASPETSISLKPKL